jgi:hypothetical protein
MYSISFYAFLFFLLYFSWHFPRQLKREYKEITRLIIVAKENKKEGNAGKKK